MDVGTFIRRACRICGADRTHVCVDRICSLCKEGGFIPKDLPEGNAPPPLPPVSKSHDTVRRPKDYKHGDEISTKIRASPVIKSSLKPQASLLHYTSTQKFFNDVKLDRITFDTTVLNEYVKKDYISKHHSSEITKNSLQILFRCIDKYFFGSVMQYFFEQSKPRNTLEFRYVKKILHRKKDTTAGICGINGGCFFFVTLSDHIFGKVFSNNEKFLYANGIKCYDTFDCILNVLEHELIHLFINICHSEWKLHISKSSHGPPFEMLALKIFGQTHFRHALLRNPEEYAIHLEALNFRKELMTGNSKTIVLPVIDNEQFKIFSGKTANIVRRNRKYIKVNVSDGKKMVNLNIPYSYFVKKMEIESDEE